MSTTELDLYRKKLCRQLSQYFDRIGIQADKTLLIYHQDIVCYVTIQQWGDEQTNNSDYLVTFRVPILHLVQRSAALHEWIAIHSNASYFHRIICDDAGNNMTTIVLEHHLLYASDESRQLHAIGVILYGLHDKYANELFQLFGGKLQRDMLAPVCIDEYDARGHDEDEQTKSLDDDEVADALKLLIKPPKTSAKIREDVRAIYAEIDKLAGLRSVKPMLEKIVARNWAAEKIQKRATSKQMVFSRHLVFTGAPGTGKTTLARYVGRLYEAINVLPSHKFIEVSAADLIARYVGQTAPNVRRVMLEARGGVLFIDEAYALMTSGEQSYGHEALAELVLMMENLRNELVVIMAGYAVQMHEMIDSNPGLRSRMTTFVEIPDYTPDMLSTIFHDMVRDHGLTVAPDVMPYITKELRRLKTSKQEFGNARFARSLWETAFTELAYSEFEDGIFGDDELRIIQKIHVERAIQTLLPAVKTTRKNIGFTPRSS